MSDTFQEQKARYAELLVRTGVNLQPGQGLVVRAELAHAELVRLVTAAAYDAGALYVDVLWSDDLTQTARMRHSTADGFDFFPDFEEARLREYLSRGWARLALVGPEAPNAFDDVDPKVMRRISQARMKRVKFYSEAMMANQVQWCVAAVPTVAWAQQIFPGVDGDAAVAKLWPVVLQMVRADLPDPVAAWMQHDRDLRQIARYMARHAVRSIHYVDPVPGPDGKPATDLMIGLVDRPLWVGGTSQTPAGVVFLPNMPTEEIFCTPHSRRAMGYVRTSKPAFPFDRKVDRAYFRFEEGAVVEFHAEEGEDVLAEFFQIPHADHLGEVSLVDVRSPVNQSGLLFFETLFDENAVCHIAFGKAYPECVEDAASMTPAELIEAGVNDSDTHVDFMIGTPTMHVYGVCSDGSRLPIMENGHFVPAIFDEE